MEIEKIMEQEELISQKMEKLQKKKMVLKERERKLLTKKLIQSGELISKAELEHIDPAALLGALLEIKEKSRNENTIKEWATKGKASLERDRVENAQQLILSFESELSPAAKSILKRLKFKWNPFRNEWYGVGKREEVEAIFQDQGIQVKIIGILLDPPKKPSLNLNGHLNALKSR